MPAIGWLKHSKVAKPWTTLASLRAGPIQILTFHFNFTRTYISSNIIKPSNSLRILLLVTGCLRLLNLLWSVLKRTTQGLSWIAGPPAGNTKADGFRGLWNSLAIPRPRMRQVLGLLWRKLAHSHGRLISSKGDWGEVGHVKALTSVAVPTFPAPRTLLPVGTGSPMKHGCNRANQIKSIQINTVNQISHFLKIGHRGKFRYSTQKFRVFNRPLFSKFWPCGILWI